ncbi:uncharacterized protein LOC110813493, partial [Carica papaya]|uniref:uncharacterized protein LOC110813493 n=1 Tax=Carica papaya TaxID=3649 RepID=UPI000B8CCA8B
MSHIHAKLKALRLDLSEELLVYFVLISLPPYFNHFKEKKKLKYEKTESAHPATVSKDKKNKKKKAVEDDSLWVVDSGCTSHMCKNEVMFVSLDKSATGQVRLENGILESIKGKGNVAIETREGRKLITDVNFVPTLSQNLLSVNQMTNNGYSVSFKNQCCRIHNHEDKLIALIPKRNQAYSLNLQEVVEMANTVTIPEGKLWHRRFGHYHAAGLLQLQKGDLTKDLPNIGATEK